MSEKRMEQLVDVITRVLRAFFEAMSGIIGGAIALVEWPAELMHVPAELLAAGILLALIVALWRGMGGIFS